MSGTPTEPAQPTAPSAKRRALAGVALLLYLVLALAFLRAPLGQLQTRIASDRGDPVFVLWVMQWGARQIGQGMPSFWHAPIFHPVRWATTFSDHLLLFGAFLYLAAAAGVAPLATYNTLVILSFALGAWSCFLVLRRSGIGLPAALLGGCFFGFSPYRLQQLPHLQILWTVCIPPTLWTFDRLLARPGRRAAGAFLAFYAPHMLAGNYLAYMIHLPLAVLLANRLVDGPSRAALWQRRRLLGGVALACAALVAAVFGPYVVAGRELGLHRSTGEILQYGGSLASYFDTATPWYARFLPSTLHREENGLFAGFLATALVLWGLARGWARLRGPRREEATPLPGRLARGGLLALAIAGVGLGEWTLWSGEGAAGAQRLVPAALIAAGLGGWLWLRRRAAAKPPSAWSRLAVEDRGLLAVGVACLVASLGYVFVAGAAVLPGLSAMRVSARFYPFVSFAIAGVAARTLDRWFGRATARRATWAACGVLALALVDLFPRAPQWPWLPRPSAVYARLASDPRAGAVLELPFFENDPENIVYLQFQTAHWRPLVNGYSGFLPPAYTALRERCQPFPGADVLAELRRLGVTHIVVHFELLRHWQRPLFRAWIDGSGLETVAAEGQVVLLSTAAEGAAQPPPHPPNRS